MNIQTTKLAGVLVIEPKLFTDNRGFFHETFVARRYVEAGIELPFVQDNHSRSVQGVLRGLHYQIEHPQGKLVYATCGAIFDVVVDINPSSPTYGRHVSIELSETNGLQVYIPPGYAHGFCVLSEFADIVYKCTDYYRSGDEAGLMWNDSELDIPWPVKDPILSEKDRHNQPLETIALNR